jgi:hypothetical protein
MPATLSIDPQTDFSAGAFQGVARHLIPRNGVYEAINSLLDDSGSIYKRGGSAVLSTAEAATNGLPLFLFDGYLSAGRRTFWADASAFGVLDGTEAPLNLAGGGITGPRRGVVIGGVLIVDGKLYAGSLKTASYSTGTISVTQGSAVITGAGTTWNTLVDVGMLLQVGGSGRYYVVKSIDSTTQITLTEAFEGTTAAGQAYVLSPMGTLPAAQQSRYYAVAGNKLVIGSGNVITFSNGISPGGTGLPPAGQLRWQTFTATDKWQLPDGAQVSGIAALGDDVLVFTTAGLYVLGNIAYDLTDAAGNLQQTLRRTTPDLILWGDAGIASWGNELIVPATDGVWLVAAGGQIKLLSHSFGGRVRDHVSQSRQPGQATVYRGHYLLPVLSAANAWADAMVCRADRPVRVGQAEVYPWTWLTGSGAKSGALGVRRASGARPRLVGAVPGSTGSRVLDLSGFFEPAAPVKNDHDGTTHEWLVTTRDITPDRLNIEAYVRQLRARYELIDAGTDNPTISAWYSGGAVATTTSNWGMNWGSNWSELDGADFLQLSGQAPEDDGRKPYPWRVGRRVRFVRFRLRNLTPAARLTLRNMEVKSRPSGRE